MSSSSQAVCPPETEELGPRPETKCDKPRHSFICIKHLPLESGLANLFLTRPLPDISPNCQHHHRNNIQQHRYGTNIQPPIHGPPSRGLRHIRRQIHHLVFRSKSLFSPGRLLLHRCPKSPPGSSHRLFHPGRFGCSCQWMGTLLHLRRIIKTTCGLLRGISGLNDVVLIWK